MKYELVIIGAGLTGINVSLHAHALGLENVLIVDYNNKYGGFTNFLFNKCEYKRERLLVERFEKLPYEKWLNATVTSILQVESKESYQVNIQTNSGTKDVETERIIICSGALEKPREAHKISGTRPAGVMTPILALGLLERGYFPGKKVSVFENSKTSRSLSKLLLNQGVDVFQIDPKEYSLHKIYGKSCLEKIKLNNKRNNQNQSVECDSLIFSKDFIPSTFFLQEMDIDLNDEHFILTDGGGKTSAKNILAFGYCTNHFETSDDQIKKSIRRLEV